MPKWRRLEQALLRYCWCTQVAGLLASRLMLLVNVVKICRERLHTYCISFLGECEIVLWAGVKSGDLERNLLN